MGNKICVYAIAKNEERFVDQWVESMKEADYIVVLDTGSEDNTVEKLKSHGVTVEQKIIIPWRFDVARNESLKLVPEDANILVCTDLDEILEPGWGDKLRDNWIDGEHVRCHYKYAWSHDDDGNPCRIFVYDKIHDKNWIWKYPVHEMLVSEYSDEYVSTRTLNMFDEIYLHHYPDKTKSRGSYLSLLELRRDESPDDYIGRFYLSHEYHYRGLYNESIDELNYLLEYERNRFTTTELAACHIFLGDNFVALGNMNRAIDEYHEAINQDRSFREPYLYAAECYNALGMYHCAVGMVKQALNDSIRHYSWLERDTSWKEQPYDILSISYFYLGDIQNSYENCMKAYKLNSHDERISNNKILIENEFYKNI